MYRNLSLSTFSSSNYPTLMNYCYYFTKSCWCSSSSSSEALSNSFASSSSMAVTFSNHHSLTLSPRFPPFRKPSTTLTFIPFNHQHSTRLPKSHLGFSITRGSFKSKSKVEEGSENDLSLKTLIPIYKEAILDVDEEAVAGIEELICTMEKEKNELAQKVEALSSDIASGRKKFIHLTADFENFRKKSEKDFGSLKSNAQVHVIKSLLPVVDSFERTKQQVVPETEKETKIVTSYQGIYKQFVETMRSLRVAIVATVGKPFDPSLHEAIAREESQEFKEGIVIQEIKRGFLLGDRVLRPAKVKVSAGPGRPKTPSTAEKPVEQPTAAAGVNESAVPNR